MKTFVTFIGRGQQDRSSEVKRYQTAVYQFEDGSLTPPVTFVGKTLIEYLAPQKVIVAGTSGSMWDELCPEGLSEDFHLLLMERADQQSVDHVLLKELQDTLNHSSIGPRFHLVLLPDSASESQQVPFFSAITEHIDHHDVITLDITHGFRFMPILAFACIQFLQFVKRVEVDDLLYALLRFNQPSPICSLKQLLEIGKWVNALGQFDHSGDLRVFESLLEKQGWDPQHIRQLCRGAFLERTTNSSDARAQLLPLLNYKWRTPIGELISDEFQSRVSWVRKPKRGERECELAHLYLQRNDFLRALIYGLEGRISKTVDAYQLGDDFQDREAAKNILKDEYGEPFHHLLQLRNNLAHGVRTRTTGKRSWINQAVTDPNLLPDRITALFKQLDI
ncbi:TPA: TIGR02221 family CRISPR-associated protein [Vibrio vulnificus]